MFDFQDETQRAGGLPHGALARVGGIVAGADAVTRAAFRARVLARRAASPPRLLFPKTLLSLAAVDVFARPGIYAFPFIGHSNGPSQNARGSSEMAGTLVHDPIIPAQVLLRRGDLGAQTVAGYAVGVVGLVHYARRASRATHVIAGLFAFSLVLCGHVRMPLALGPKKCTLVPVGFPIGATHRTLESDIGAVWGTHTPGLIPLVHFALLSRTTIHIVTRLFARYTVGSTAVEDQPSEQRVIGHIFLGPCRAQSTAPAAVFSAHPGHVQNLASSILALLKPAVAGLNFLLLHEVRKPDEKRDDALAQLRDL